MAGKDMEAFDASFRQGKGNDGRAVAGDKILSAVSKVPVFFLGKFCKILRKQLFFHGLDCVEAVRAGFNECQQFF